MDHSSFATTLVYLRPERKPLVAKMSKPKRSYSGVGDGHVAQRKGVELFNPLLTLVHLGLLLELCTLCQESLDYILEQRNLVSS